MRARLSATKLAEVSARYDCWTSLLMQAFAFSYRGVSRDLARPPFNASLQVLRFAAFRWLGFSQSDSVRLFSCEGLALTRLQWLAHAAEPVVWIRRAEVDDERRHDRWRRRHVRWAWNSGRQCRQARSLAVALIIEGLHAWNLLRTRRLLVDLNRLSDRAKAPIARLRTLA
jgi:hypothetical protein